MVHLSVDQRGRPSDREEEAVPLPAIGLTLRWEGGEPLADVL